MDCRDCEAFLQMGIDAFHWILRADTALRTADVDGKIAYTAELEQSLESLAKAWLKPCDLAERLIKLQQERNFEPGNLGEFRECCKEMRAIVEFNESWQNESLPPGWQSSETRRLQSTGMARLPSSFRKRNRTSRRFRES